MSYYTGFKKISFDGVPMRVAPWYGELGNDAEFIEATKPRDNFKPAYYAGGFRMVKNGVPCRLAGYVAGWAPWMRAALHRGTVANKDNAEIKRQATVLGLVK